MNEVTWYANDLLSRVTRFARDNYIVKNITKHHKIAYFFIFQTILFIGGWGPTKSIYQFNPSSGTWTLFGNMKYERAYHAVDLVNYDEFSKYCK